MGTGAGAFGDEVAVDLARKGGSQEGRERAISQEGLTGYSWRKGCGGGKGFSE
jgi:hypothetical protein